MRLVSFVAYQLRWQLLRKRWLLPFLLAFFLAVQTIGTYEGKSSRGSVGLAPANAWDVMFGIIGHSGTVYFTITLLFLYLVSDLLPELTLGQFVLLRLRSRKLWWVGKVLTLLILTLVYLAVVVGPIALVTTPVYRWGGDYSELAHKDWLLTSLPADLFRNGEAYISPPELLIQSLILLFLGLFTFGLIMMVVNQWTRKHYWGLLSGVTLLFVSYVSIQLSGPPAWSMYLPGPHLTYTAGIPLRRSPLIISIGYWAVLIIVLLVISLVQAKNQDHVALQD